MADTPPTTIPADTIYCPACKGGSPANALRCMWCGASLTPPPQQQFYAPPPVMSPARESLAAVLGGSFRRNIRIWSGIAIFVMIVALAGVIGQITRLVSNPFKTSVYTTVSALGISAKLPGESWKTDGIGHTIDDTIDDQDWVRSDSKLMFSVALDRANNKVSSTSLNSLFSRYDNLIGSEWRGSPTASSLGGYPALRKDEGRFGRDSDTRNIGYVVVAHGQAYYLDAWGLNGDWDNGASDAVQAIFDSVSIKWPSLKRHPGHVLGHDQEQSET